MITYLLPLLIGYTGGRMVYGVRGGVVGAVATTGVIVGTDIPMFIGAMILGPLTAWLMMKLDKIWEGRVKPGFEMLIDNFSAGILAAGMAVVGMLVVGPVVKAFSDGASAVVEFLVINGLLPFTSIFIEPAKVLFLNNAVNHGILTPAGYPAGARGGQVHPVPARSQPRSGLRHPARLLDLRHGPGQGVRAGCGPDPVRRRHP